jgi:hypothetical protein
VSVFGSASAASPLTLQHPRDNTGWYDSAQTTTSPVGDLGTTVSVGDGDIRLASSAVATTATMTANG